MGDLLQERIKRIVEINGIAKNSHNKWNGKSKYYTKQCPICICKVDFGDESRCYYGTAWKVLVNHRDGKLRKCEYFNDQYLNEEVTLKDFDFSEKQRINQRPALDDF